METIKVVCSISLCGENIGLNRVRFYLYCLILAISCSGDVVEFFDYSVINSVNYIRFDSLNITLYKIYQDLLTVEEDTSVVGVVDDPTFYEECKSVIKTMPASTRSKKYELENYKNETIYFKYTSKEETFWINYFYISNSERKIDKEFMKAFNKFWFLLKE